MTNKERVNILSKAARIMSDVTIRYIMEKGKTDIDTAYALFMAIVIVLAEEYRPNFETKEEKENGSEKQI